MKTVSRRHALRTLGLSVVTLPLINAACGGPGGGDDGTSDGGAPSGRPDASTGAADAADAGGWASGGTAGMADTYPDPFTDEPGAACALTCAMTLGPCHSTTFDRRDVSEGITGLPVRLALRVVDEACQPVSGATVEIWHTARNGLYSGDGSSPDLNLAMCTSNDPEATSHNWFRGSQVTDARGRVDFHTCYPGWYSGRAIHIHFRVQIGTSAYIVSQLFFAETLTAEIFASHPDYAEFGQPNTTNSTDSQVTAETVVPYILDTRRMTDGVMQAYKTLVIRSSLSDPSCSVPRPGRR